MRGKDISLYYTNKFHRITPAYAGKSARIRPAKHWIEDHPRLCGEKAVLNEAAKKMNGITPAYAGKS